MATRRRTTIIVIVFVVVIALIVTVAVTGQRVSRLATSLARVVNTAEQIKKDVGAADLSAVSTDLATLDIRTKDALVAVSDPLLSATLDGIPIVGPHLVAARELTSALAGLTAAARPLAKLLPRLEPDNLVTDGRYDVTALRDLDTVMKDLSSQLQISSAQIAGIRTKGLDSRLVSIIDTIGPSLDDAETLVTKLEPLVSVLPIVLDSTQKRTWFVALQNLAEARATGGLLGAYAVLDVDGGKITMTASGSDRDLIPVKVGYTGLPSDFVDDQRDNIDEWRSINVSPNFPYTGRLVTNIWKAHTGQDVDGVIAFGQGIVQYMLAATGPVTIDGTSVDASNVIQFLSLGVYSKYPDADDKNLFVAKLVSELFSRLQNGRFDLQSLLTSTATTTTGDRMLLWSPHDDVQAQIASIGMGGIVPTDAGPTAIVAVNNGGGNKLEQFLHTTVSYTLGECSADPNVKTRAATLTITLTNSAPTSGLPAYVTPRLDYAGAGKPVGSNLEVVSVYMPVGAEDGDTTLDGESEFAEVGQEREHPELQFAVELDPGQTRTIVAPWTEPTVGANGIDRLGAHPTVITQPSLNPIIVKAPAASACN